MPRPSRILGPDGQPVMVSDLTREVAAASIGSVRSPVAGDPSGGLTPDRLAVILRQAEQGDPLAYYELAERIEEKDPHYLGVLSTRKQSVAQIDITVEAASEDAGHQRQAEELRAWLRRDELQEELVDILDAIGKGVSYTEIVWETSEGQYQPRKLAWRDPRWFTFDTGDGETPLLRDAAGNMALPGFKFIRAEMKAKSGLAIRGGLTRIACWAWMFKAFTQRDWAIFTQTYGQPIRVGKYQAGATKEEKDTLYQAVVNIATDCAAIMPASMQVEFIEAKSIGASTDHYERRSDWLNREISKAVLGQTTTTEAISGGHAVAREHRLVQEDIERADAKRLSAILNRDLVRPFVILNHGEQKLYPRLVIARPERRDVKQILDGIAQVVPMGVPVAVSYVNDLLGLPDAAPGEALLQAPKSTSVPPAKDGTAPPEPGADDKDQALNSAMPAPRDAIDDLAEAALGDWEEMVAPVLAQVQAELDQATSLEDFKARLAGLADKVATGQLAEALAKASVTAQIAGLAGAGTGRGTGR